jgi:AraC-like DNA-binding protein
VPARAASLIEFEFGDSVKVEYRKKSGAETSPRVAVVGLQTYRRAQLLLQGVIESFVILFQPTGFNQLFSIPMSDLTDNDYEARSVLGPFISGLEERLGNCNTFTERVRVADEYLLPRALDGCGFGTISTAASQILLGAGNVRIPALADMAGLSTRQFERRFFQEVGTSPKLYARIARFEAALDCKARSLRKSWTDVAHGFGYHDQMHMIHDFESFTGDTPTKILCQVEAVFQEQIEAMRSAGHCTDASPDERLIL